jgi:dihydrofolate reductase
MTHARDPGRSVAAFWSPMTGEWADLLHPMPKFVASRTLREPLTWNATLIKGDVADAVTKLKEELDGELARHLVAHDLVDELRFWLHPAVWGRGPAAV